jgi:hypothetical protein
LLTELGNITSADLAAAWARDALTAKNSLSATDAKLVEDAFERRLSELPSSDAASPLSGESSVPQISEPQVNATSDRIDAGQAKGIDKSMLTVAAPRRYRNREHLRYVAQQACLLCALTRANSHGKISRLNNGPPDQPASGHESLSTAAAAGPPLGPWSMSRTPAQCLLRLSNLDSTLLDRMGRYETRLWRQAAQTIWVLEAMRRPPPPIRQRLRHGATPFAWDRGRG